MSSSKRSSLDSPSCSTRDPSRVCLDSSFLSPEEYLSCVRKRFPETENVFSPEGVEKDSLLLSMQYISLATQHDIRINYPNDHTIIFYCGLASGPSVFTSKSEDSVDDGMKDQLLDSRTGCQAEKPPVSELSGKRGCGFFLCYRLQQKRGTELWV